MEIGHEDTLRLGLSINTRVICNVYWEKWVDRDGVKVVRSRYSLNFRESTYFSLFFGVLRDEWERYWAYECSYPVYADVSIDAFEDMKENTSLPPPPLDIFDITICHLDNDFAILTRVKQYASALHCLAALRLQGELSTRPEGEAPCHYGVHF